MERNKFKYSNASGSLPKCAYASAMMRHNSSLRNFVVTTLVVIRLVLNPELRISFGVLLKRSTKFLHTCLQHHSHLYMNV